MSSVPLSAANTGASVRAQLTPGKLWQKLIDKHEENADFYQTMEGGEDSFIVTRTDTSKGEGQELVIRVESGFYNEPHFGDEQFEDETHFEENLFKDYSLKVDVIRHATSATERAEEYLGIRGEIMARMPQKLGKWLGRYKTENLDMMFRELVNAQNVIRPNGKTKETIASADGLSYNFISTAASALKRMGGQKAVAGVYTTGKMSGNKARRYALIACSDALTVLKQDASYQSMLASAQTRGSMNPYFSGEIQDLDGITIVERDVIDHDGVGAIGSPLNPRALLGAEFAAGSNSAIEIKGGGNATNAAKTGKKYFKYFKNYDYKFSSYGSAGTDNFDSASKLTKDSNEHYVMIINPPTAGATANKWGMYAYTSGNDGNKITTLKNLRAADGGTHGKQTVGAVTWNAAINTDIHPAGSLIVQCNAKGEPLGYSYLLAHAAAFRGYGKYRNKRGEEFEEDGFVKKSFLRSYFGQKLRQDRNNQHTGVMVLEHALHYKDLPLATVV